MLHGLEACAVTALDGRRFLERSHALQERRPLLDNGIEVHHMGDDGELVRIEA